MPEDYWDLYNRNNGGTGTPFDTFGTGTENTQPSQAATGSNSSMSASDWWDWAKFAYGVYRDRNPKKPEFADVPLSPEERQMYQIYIQSMLNPATVNNAAALNQMATQMLGGLSGMQWQSPPTFSGASGYSGSNLGFTPPTSGAGGQQWPGGGSTRSGPPSTGSDPGIGGPYSPYDTTGGYVNGGPFNSDYAPGGAGTGPNTAPQTDMGALYDMFKRYIGPWNSKEETYEKWISRGASIVGGMFGFPVPAGLVDKGIDAAQWLWRTMRGQQGSATPQQPSTPFERFYANPNSGEFGSTYGNGAQNVPPGLAPKPHDEGWGLGRKPSSGYGVTGSDNAFSGFGAPGSVTPPPAQPSGYQVDPRTGQTSRENNPFNYGGYAGGQNEYWNNEFWRGLQSGPGYPDPGGAGSGAEPPTGGAFLDTRNARRARAGGRA